MDGERDRLDGAAPKTGGGGEAALWPSTSVGLEEVELELVPNHDEPPPTDANGEALDMNDPKPDMNDLGVGELGEPEGFEAVSAETGVPPTLANGEAPEKAAKPV